MYTLAFLMLWIMWFGVKYELRGELLILRFGPFWKKIDVNTFQQITYSRSVIASAAMAIKRLEILYDNFQMVHISPKNEELFVQKMMEINPKIEVKNKRKNDKGDD
ncbi:PH domain-containing protein [Halalkalibacillus sediminis]|uniref:PH domain-containing protein n=1 Tax=Halalkalibacillus sediminis TaxID=2018042 RepID=UPI00138FCA16|nr:PH domain-containing protein [Halalkalibacillus sediminis]